MEQIKIKKKIKFQPRISLMILCVVLIAYTITFFIPLIWTVFTSFKKHDVYMFGTTRKDLEMMFGFSDLTLQNYATAFKYFSIPTTKRGDIYIFEMFFNSILYAGGCAIVATIIPCVMAYLVARYNYRFGKVVYGIVIVTMSIPIVGSLPSEIKMVENLNLMDSVLGLYVLKSNFLGIYFLVFFAQFKMIPKDYTEAASIDGASEFYTMVKIIFPIAIGTISTVLLLKFIEFWNDYQIPMIYWESRPVIAYGLYYFVGLNKGQDGLAQAPVKLAGMIIVAMPIIALFIAFNKKVMSNMSIGGVKG